MNCTFPACTCRHPATCIEHLSDVLYAIGQESQTGWQHMKELCAAVGVTYPPQSIKKGEPAPVTLAFP